jgi:hypothetical protein
VTINEPSKAKNSPKIEKVTEALRFDAQSFLATVGVGRTIGKYQPDQPIFAKSLPRIIALAR